MRDFQAFALGKGQPVTTNSALTSKALVSDSTSAEAFAASCTLAVVGIEVFAGLLN